MADPELETRTSQILFGMTKNSNFAKPIPTVEVAQEAADAFSAALGMCSEGDRLKIAIKNQKRKALLDVLHQWAFYVLLTANGNEAIAISSGFKIGKAPAPAPPLAKPEAPSLSSGIDPGEIVCAGKRLAGAISYLHQYATEAMLIENNWQAIPSSKCTCLITNLNSGEKYYFRIAALGSKEQLVYSDVVNRVAA